MSGVGRVVHSECLELVMSYVVFFRGVVLKKMNFCLQVKAAIAAHPGNLDAAGAACVELADEDDGASCPNRPTSPVYESKGAQEEHVLQSLQNSIQQPRELIQNLGQPQTISERTAFANYVHNSLLTMKKSKFKRMRLAINKLLTQAMDDSEDEEEPGPHPTVQPNMSPPVRSVSPNIL